MNREREGGRAGGGARANAATAAAATAAAATAARGRDVEVSSSVAMSGWLFMARRLFLKRGKRKTNCEKSVDPVNSLCVDRALFRVLARARANTAPSLNPRVKTNMDADAPPPLAPATLHGWLTAALSPDPAARAEGERRLAAAEEGAVAGLVAGLLDVVGAVGAVDEVRELGKKGPMVVRPHLRQGATFAPVSRRMQA